MPQSGKSLRKEWGIDPGKAITYLKKTHNLVPDRGVYLLPADTSLTAKAIRALNYLAEEWDYAHETVEKLPSKKLKPMIKTHHEDSPTVGKNKPVRKKEYKKSKELTKAKGKVYPPKGKGMDTTPKPVQEFTPNLKNINVDSVRQSQEEAYQRLEKEYEKERLISIYHAGRVIRYEKEVNLLQEKVRVEEAKMHNSLQRTGELAEKMLLNRNELPSIRTDNMYDS